MRRKCVVFSKMFILRSMGNELVPSPHISNNQIVNEIMTDNFSTAVNGKLPQSKF